MFFMITTALSKMKIVIIFYFLKKDIQHLFGDLDLSIDQLSLTKSCLYQVDNGFPGGIK